MNLVKFIAQKMFPNVRTVGLPLNTLSRVWYGSSINAGTSDQGILDKLKQRFPDASDIKVTDISGGCGAMFDIYVESSEFKGLPMVKQHRIVNECLKEQIKDMHGLRIVTAAPKPAQ